jgi:Na+/proline symporter
MSQKPAKPPLRGLARAIGYFFWPGFFMAAVSLVLAIDAGFYDAFKNYNPGGNVAPADPWHANGQPILLVCLAAVGLVNSVLLLVASSSLDDQDPVDERAMVVASQIFGVIGIIWTLIQLLVNISRIH